MTFDELIQMIFVDWILYNPDEIKHAKTCLQDVCPHKEIIDDYIEVDIEYGQQVKYCNLCLKCF